MEDRRYDVIMQTILGERKGSIQMCMEGKRVTGILDILGHAEPFEGEIDPEGNCELRGRMITLVRNISYTATGKIREEELDLSVEEERNIFIMHGIRRRAERESGL
jgi:hypothetical protein